MAVSGQFAIAKQATYTWTPASGGEAQSTVGFRNVAWREGRHKYLTVPAGYEHERYTLGVQWCQAVLGGMFDSSGATPPSPGTTANTSSVNPGILVVTFASGKTKTMKGFMHQLDWSAQGGSVGPEQEYQWAFVGSAESATDTITTA